MGSAFYISVDDNGRGEHPPGYGHDAKEMVNKQQKKRTVQSIQCVPSWFYGDRLNERSARVSL